MKVADLRRENAKKQQEIRDSRTPEQQLAVLDVRLGKNQGAQKERKRLQALIKKQAG